MHYKICRTDLAKINKKYVFNMEDVEDEQWLSLATAIIFVQEKTVQEKELALKTAFLKVNFTEGQTSDCALANVNLQYIKTNDELAVVNKVFDINGLVGEENQFVDDMWADIAYNSLNYISHKVD